MSAEEVPALKLHRQLVQELLDKAAEIKQCSTIEPPLTAIELGDSIRGAQPNKWDGGEAHKQQAHYAVVETAFREKFSEMVATTSIDEPDFVQVWNLLDIVAIFSDDEQCEPGLIFWLIEELLDSQTIDGCRKVFDYLESRRERHTVKHFKQKSLIILRSCNELLRRLSRAEDTVFCGRVFIFLFQSFPLGDKSSVNLRGEYHTENLTTFDDIQKPIPSNENAMDIDASDEKDKPDTNEQSTAEGKGGDTTEEAKSDRASEEKAVNNETLDMDALYPVFWGLQAYFSAPTKLFDAEKFASFKSGIEATLASFRKVSADLETRGLAKGSEDSRRGTKRKRNGETAEVTTNFNPKYLTSRDLFELEVNDVAFRRHILVQALILLNFLLSLTPKAKSKLVNSTNKSVLYGFVLNDDDAQWISQTKASIASYLQQGLDGKFYYRMVDTVLTRDKNWVRWKADGCPPIERPAISPEQYLDSRSSAAKVTASRRLRTTPLGSLDLAFLTDSAKVNNLDRLKEQQRFTVPEADSYMRSILDDEFRIDMSQTSEEKEEAAKAKSSKTWRTLRLAARSQLNLLDKVDDGKNLKVLFEPTETDTASQHPVAEDSINQGKEDSKSETKENIPTHGETLPNES